MAAGRRPIGQRPQPAAAVVAIETGLHNNSGTCQSVRTESERASEKSMIDFACEWVCPNRPTLLDRIFVWGAL